jgi:hypothetical protein
MAGRVLRRAAGIAVKNVVQCAATRHPFTATAVPAAQYVQAAAGWESIGLNDRVEEMSSRMLDLLVQLSKAEREAKAARASRRGRDGGPAKPGGLREIRPWNFRVEESRDRFPRRGADDAQS